MDCPTFTEQLQRGCGQHYRSARNAIERVKWSAAPHSAGETLTGETDGMVGCWPARRVERQSGEEPARPTGRLRSLENRQCSPVAIHFFLNMFEI
jgi:hypothetical protein